MSASTPSSETKMLPGAVGPAPADVARAEVVRGEPPRAEPPRAAPPAGTSPQEVLDAPIASAMTPQPVCLEEEATLADAAIAMARHGFRHIVVTRDGRLAGGLYGVSIGGLFAGESMFHRERDASKVALVGLVDLLRADGDPRRLVDVQWRTDHLASLGVSEVPRTAYLALLEEALTAPLPAPWR